MQEQLIKQECLEKLIKGSDQSGMCRPQCPDIKHITIKWHEVIPNGY